MSLFTSISGGDSWSAGYVLWPGPSAYSTVTPLPGGSNVGVLYERGFDQDIENITFASVGLAPAATVALKADDCAHKHAEISRSRFPVLTSEIIDIRKLSYFEFPVD